MLISPEIVPGRGSLNVMDRLKIEKCAEANADHF